MNNKEHVFGVKINNTHKIRDKKNPTHTHLTKTNEQFPRYFDYRPTTSEGKTWSALLETLKNVKIWGVRYNKY